jgi:hypothetical protein
MLKVNNCPRKLAKSGHPGCDQNKLCLFFQFDSKHEHLISVAYALEISVSFTWLSAVSAEQGDRMIF